MRKNNGENTKKITLVVPESTEVIDIAYYWKTANGNCIKTTSVIMDEHCCDGHEVTCYDFTSLLEEASE